MDPDFFRYQLLHIGLFNLSDNSGIPQLNNKQLYPALFAVPPLDEQQAIGRCPATADRGIDAETAMKRQVERTKSALMSVLLTGELRVTPDETTA